MKDIATTANPAEDFYQAVSETYTVKPPHADIFLEALRSNKAFSFILQKENEIGRDTAVNMMRVLLTQTDQGTGYLKIREIADEVHFFAPFVDDVMDVVNNPSYEQARAEINNPDDKYRYIELNYGS